MQLEQTMMRYLPRYITIKLSPPELRSSFLLLNTGCMYFAKYRMDFFLLLATITDK